MPTNSHVSAEVTAKLRACEERLRDPLLHAVPEQVRTLLATGAALTTWRVLRDDGIATLRSSVWQQQQDGRWQMVFHQGTQAAFDDEATS